MLEISKLKNDLSKILYNNKPIRLNNKYSAAKKSLSSIEEITKDINDKVNLELINLESRKIENK